MKLFNRKKNNSNKNPLQAFSIKGREKTKQDKYFMSDLFDNNRLVLLADGLRNSKHGEFASSQVIEVFKNFFVQMKNFDDPATFLHRTTLVAATMLMNKSAANPEYAKAATSLTGFLITKNKYYTVNVGDSRVYHFSGKKLYQKTKDQTLVQQLIDEKSISEEEAFMHPKKGEPINFISTVISDIKTDIDGPFTLKKNDLLLATSSGLHHQLKNVEIESIIKKNLKKKNLAQILGDFAYNTGSKNNITICIYKHLEK